MATWDEDKAPDETCSACGSIYEVTIKHYPARDQDKFDCQVCGRLMNRWNSTASPSYSLKTRGTAPHDRAR